MAKHFVSLALLLMIAGGAFFFLNDYAKRVDQIADESEPVLQAVDSTQGVTVNSAPASGSQIPNQDETPEHVQIALTTLDQVLNSKNDNDPRIDLLWKGMDESIRQAFLLRYRSLPLEKRNERGTILYLLVRGAETSADLGFLSEVAREKPCLGFESCAKEAGPTEGEHLHSESGADVTLNYPQIVSIFQLEEILKRSASSAELKSSARAKLKEFAEFEAPIVRERAQAAISRHPN